MILSPADFFQNKLFQKNLSEIPLVSNSLDPNKARRSGSAHAVCCKCKCIKCQF